MVRSIFPGLWLFLFVCVSVSGQEQVVDSLKERFFHLPGGKEKEKQKVAHELATHYLGVNLDSAKRYNETSFLLSEQGGNKKQVLNPLFVAVAIANREQDYPLCDSLYDEIFERISGIEDNQNLLPSYFASRGVYYQRRHMPDSAIAIYQQALQDFDENGKDYHLMSHSILYNMGLLEKRRGDFRKALNYYTAAQSHMEKDTFSLTQQFKIYNSIALTYRGLGNYPSSLFYFEKALSRTEPQSTNRYRVLHNMGEVYLDTDNYEGAKRVVDSIPLFEGVLSAKYQCRSSFFTLQTKLALGESIALDSLTKLSDCFRKGYISKNNYWIFMGRYHESVGNYSEAMDAYENGLSEIKELSGAQMRQKSDDLYQYLSLAIKVGQPNDSLPHYFQQYAALKDTINQVIQYQEVEKWKTALETQEKELQNQALLKENDLQATINQNQRLGLIGLGIGVFLLGFLAFTLYRQQRKLQRQKKEIEVLHREQGHRMMNNLVFTNSLLSLQVRRLKEQPEAQQAIREAESRLRAMTALHERLHRNAGAKNEVNLHDYLLDMVGVLKSSFSTADRPLKIELTCAPECVEGDAAMRLGLIVNELVTNSCKHAFEQQSDPKIQINLEKEGLTEYRLHYSDNGSGLPEQLTSTRGQSMGLFLLQNLIKQLDGRILTSNASQAIIECQLKLKAA